MTDKHNQEYLAAASCASLLLAARLQERTSAPEGLARLPDALRRGPLADSSRADRANKMGRVIDAKRSATIAVLDGNRPTQATLRALTADWSSDQRIRMLVDLVSGDPFAPYSLKFDRDDLIDGVRDLARAIGEPGVVDEIEAARDSAMKAYRTTIARKVVMVGALTAVTLASAGWLAAPAIGTAIGSAAGLTGAAATAHGLALLGGGTLASGGFGMAGGMWLVAGAGATVGVLGGSTSAMFYELGAAETRAELVKLQVTFRVAVLGAQNDLIKAQTIVSQLIEQEFELRRRLDEERLLNDENSRRVEDFEEKLADLITAREWMQAEQEHAG